MSAVINLNYFSKTRKKAKRKTLAARTRVRYGRRKDDHQRNEMAEERSKRDLDGPIP